MLQIFVGGAERVPTIPWYNQIRLHNFIRKNILTPEQKEVFLLRPIIGFPSKLIDILRTTKKRRAVS